MASAEPRVLHLPARAPVGGSRRAVLLAALAATAASLTAWPAQSEDMPAVQFGPIRFGMSVAEIQAAVPGARWEVTSTSEFTGRPFRLVAADALDYGGWRMTIGVRDEKYDRHVELTSAITAPDAAACEQAGLALFTALEGSADTLTANRDPNGESVAFGNGSTALFTAFDASSNRVPRKRLARGKVDRMGLATRREAERLEVKGHVSFNARDAGNCTAHVIAIAWRQQPPPEVMAYEEKKVVGRMSIGDRHRLASPLVFSGDAVVAPLQCQVSRQSGKVLLCGAPRDPAVDPAWADVAGRYAGAMRFDMSGLDRDDPQPALVEIPVRVARSDVRPPVVATNLLPVSQVEFVAAPTAKDLQDAFPWKALRTGVGAEVDVACRIEDDGSLICATLRVQQAPGVEQFRVDFERAVDKLVPLHRAAPALKDGKPSAGASFRMAVAFKVSD